MQHAAVSGRYPDLRLRRVRSTPALRALTAETELSPRHLILPLFVRKGTKLREPVASMPGVFRFSPDEAVREATLAFAAGVPAVILFGIAEKKDPEASGAYDSNGIVQETVRLLRAEIPELLVVTDVCLCEYMSHGHCGVVEKAAGSARILNDASLKLLSRVALSHAEAGSGLVAPSDMMDGRVSAIRGALDSEGFEDVPIMSYAAKYASAFYGPFRDAAESSPQFGDRRSYQMYSGNSDEALREVAQDIAEGADIVMVKPALAYLDIVRRVKDQFRYPTAAYAVSGEYSMIKAASERGWVDERAITIETHLAMRRAGADIILTYAAKDLAVWLKG